MLYGSKPDEIDPKFGASVTYEYGKNLYVNMTNHCPNRCDSCAITATAASMPQTSGTGTASRLRRRFGRICSGGI